MPQRFSEAEGGRVIETGTYGELLQRSAGSRFYEMLQLQES